MCLHFILSDNSLEYYFQRTIRMWSKRINVALPLVKGFAAGVYVDGQKEIMFCILFFLITLLNIIFRELF